MYLFIYLFIYLCISIQLIPEFLLQIEEEYIYRDNNYNRKEENPDEVPDIKELEVLTPKTNPYLVEFLERTQHNPKQIIRYIPHTERIEQKSDDIIQPLWYGQPPNYTIPNCSICNTPMSLEFQVMPQLIYILEKYDMERCDDRLCKLRNSFIKLQDTLDFSTICIFTCPYSCSAPDSTYGSYTSEFLVYQGAE